VHSAGPLVGERCAWADSIDVPVNALQARAKDFGFIGFLVVDWEFDWQEF